jgi:hypothetical protein
MAGRRMPPLLPVAVAGIVLLVVVLAVLFLVF